MEKILNDVAVFYEDLYQLKINTGSYFRIQHLHGLLETFEYQQISLIHRELEKLEELFDCDDLKFHINNDYPNTREDIIEFTKHLYNSYNMIIKNGITLINKIFSSELGNINKNYYSNKLTIICNTCINLVNHLSVLIEKLCIGYQMNIFDDKIVALFKTLDLNYIHLFKGVQLSINKDDKTLIFKFVFYRKVKDYILNTIIKEIKEKIAHKYSIPVKVEVKYVNLFVENK